MKSKDPIRRLQQRIQSEPTVDFAFCCPPIRPRPPVSEQALADAQAQLGFALPPLIRALYTQVADGGYGPGYGITQLAGHAHALVESHSLMSEGNEASEETSAEWLWPERLVVFVHWGCNYFSGIDCSRPSCPVLFYDSDRAIGEAKLADYLLPGADSVAEWLLAWLDGENLWERGKQRRLHC